MIAHTEAIAAALAPGIALNSVIFYNTSLQNRLVHVAGRVRDLNREARGLRARGAADGDERLASIRWQVNALGRRSRTVLRAILIAYGALGCFILTILGLLVVSFTGTGHFSTVPTLTFSCGLCTLGTSVFFSWSESRLSSATLMEDIRSSHPPQPAGAPQAD